MSGVIHRVSWRATRNLEQLPTQIGGSNRIVGYSMDSRMTAGLAVSALRNAIALRSPAGTVVVTPIAAASSGPPPSSPPEQQRPDRLHGPRRGLWRQRRDGIILRAAQKNVLDRQRWPDREQLRLAIITWIERTYHRRRLGRLTPVEYETINQAAHAA